jgi:hypothetical protein
MKKQVHEVELIKRKEHGLSMNLIGKVFWNFTKKSPEAERGVLLQGNRR